MNFSCSGERKKAEVQRKLGLSRKRSQSSSRGTPVVSADSEQSKAKTARLQEENVELKNKVRA